MGRTDGGDLDALEGKKEWKRGSSIKTWLTDKNWLLFLWFSGSVNWNVQWLFSVYCINLLVHNPSSHSSICPSLLFFVLHFTYFLYFCNEFKCQVSTVCLCWSVTWTKHGVFRAFWHMWNKKNGFACKKFDETLYS